MTASTAMLTSCSSDDPFENYMSGNNGFGPENNEPSGNTPSGNGSSAITGELTTFDIALDKTTAEPTDVADAYFPDEEDILENNEFTTEIAIDLSNPVAKTENGVEITVNGGHITANHGDTKKICYVLSGSTDNGSFTVAGNKKYAVELNGVSITNPDSAALRKTALAAVRRVHSTARANCSSTAADSSA